MLTRPASNVEDSTSQLARTGQGEKNRLWVPDIPRRGAPLLVDPAVKVGPGLTGARDILHGPRLFVGDGRLQSLSRYRGRMSSPRVPGGVVHRLPPDLRKALVANPTVLDAWRDITPGPQRIHLLGRRRQAGHDSGTPHSADRGGARARPATALLLARMQAPRAQRQLNVPDRVGDVAVTPGPDFREK